MGLSGSMFSNKILPLSKPIFWIIYNHYGKIIVGTVANGVVHVRISKKIDFYGQYCSR